MSKNLFKLVQNAALILLACMFFNCSDSNEPKNEPEPEPEPELPIKVFEGHWLKSTTPYQWIVDKNGDVKSISIEHVFNNSSLDIYRDSVRVKINSEFKLDFIPEDNMLTITEGEKKSEALVTTLEPDRIKFKDLQTEKETTLKKRGVYCTAAPKSIAGLYLAALRYKVHGMLFRSVGEVLQYYHYEEVIDYEISEYTYQPGDDNTAHLTYHVKYRINPNKVISYTGNPNAGIDITFDIEGELDMTFWSYVYDEKYKTELYTGEFDGKVTSIVTNNRTGKVSTSEITGVKPFAMMTPDEE